MYGDGIRRNCPTCGQDVRHITDILSHRELRGPRNITSANLDRIFDDGGRRFLVIEEKTSAEKLLSSGQRGLLLALARLPMFTVWFARGTPQSLELFDFGSDQPWPFLEGDFTQYQNAVSRWFASQRRVSA